MTPQCPHPVALLEWRTAMEYERRLTLLDDMDDPTLCEERALYWWLMYWMRVAEAGQA